MTTAAPEITTLGDLKASGYAPRSLRAEILEHLQQRLRSRESLFPGILGYEDTVVPAVQNALLCGHDLIFLGERGQAKSRMIRALTGLLDDWVPVIRGSEVNDDPFAPISAFGRGLLAEHGDDTPIAWLAAADRYAEKLATPDVSVADLIGDVDPIKVAEGRHLSDEYTIHFGLLPRCHRGIFCINELPDLTEKVQVGLFNVLEERDVQIKGYQVRMPLDVLVVASANPEDYTSRGRIITPLKDRYAAQVRTHYPADRATELAIARQEAVVPDVPGIDLRLPPFMEAIVAEITFEARHSPDIAQASGVSVRMTVANYETLMANALRRALHLGESEAVPRCSDLAALLSSTQGKIELEYAGADTSEEEIIEGLVRRATRRVFDEELSSEGLATVVEAFNQGWQVEVGPMMAAADYLEGLDEIPGLRDAAAGLAGGDSPARLASAIEFILEGLHLHNQLNKKEGEAGARFQAA
jgi:magnesium chelatase subunit I